MLRTRVTGHGPPTTGPPAGMYLLDTNVCIHLLNGSSEPLVGEFRRRRPSEIALCSIVKGELSYGARKSRDSAHNLRLLERFFAPMRSFPFDDRAAERYGAIRFVLERSGSPIGANDLLIAAIAIARDAVLVTHNVREFTRVPDLKLEDWEAG